jgi:hypothetical protein
LGLLDLLTLGFFDFCGLLDFGTLGLRDLLTFGIWGLLELWDFELCDLGTFGFVLNIV